jgi:hypothetical protein
MSKHWASNQLESTAENADYIFIASDPKCRGIWRYQACQIKWLKVSAKNTVTAVSLNLQEKSTYLLLELA